MKALLYRDWNCLELADVPKPEPSEGEVLVRVEACGICGSEIECVEQRSPRRTPPLILGHEFSGTVEALGTTASRFREGDRVVANSVIPCGNCFSCRRGETNLCHNRTLFGMHRPGACAEFVTAPESVLYPRPKEMDPVLGALAEPAANGVHAMSLLPGHPKRTVFVFGAGIIGLMVLQAARALCNARVAVVDLIATRCALALELGAEKVFDGADDNVVNEAIAFSGVDGVDYAVDAVGAKVTKEQSIEVVRPGGAVCWLGLRDNMAALETFPVTLMQKAVTGSYSATEPEYLTAVRLLCEGKISAGNAVCTFPMNEAVEGFRRMADPAGGIVRAVILPTETT